MLMIRPPQRRAKLPNGLGRSGGGCEGQEGARGWPDPGPGTARRRAAAPPSSGEAPSGAGGGPSPSRLALEPRPRRAAGDGTGGFAPVAAVVRRCRGAATMASTRAGCSASSTAGGVPLPRAPPRQPLYLSSPLAVARHPRRLLPRLAPRLQEGTPCDPATGLLHLDCESVWFLGGILGDWSL